MITSNLLRKLIQKLLRNSNASYPVSPEQVQKINRILVVGAGTMGTQIAVQCASHGRLVFLYDNIRAVMEQAPARLERLAQDLAAKGLLGSSTPRETLRRIEPTTDMAAAAQAAIVIECVPENLELKKSVFEQLGRHCRPETIYVTNTSSLVPSQLSGSCRHPERMAALHFHLPVATSNVVDLMPHPGTDPGVVAALDAFAREIGKVPIHYKREYHGYIFNSIFGAMQRQALDLVIQGIASVEDIDRSWMGIYKMPIGPFGMFDRIGLDTIAELLGHWAETLNDDAGGRRGRIPQDVDGARIPWSQVEPRLLSISVSRLCRVWIFERRQDPLEGSNRQTLARAWLARISDIHPEQFGKVSRNHDTRRC
jgi:3-hydroxybutyryl-CoA dehydrogenase